MLPSSDLTKSQVDRLGDRLRTGDISDDDLRLLDSYRRSFSDAYEDVVGQIRDRLELEPTGKPAKSTTSISEKLRRESIRLSQMQDIAGCRVVVTDVPTQNEAVARLKEFFERVTVVDRREHPSHGYRAVHLIVEHSGNLVEVQVRTSLQHLWAELSEKLSDVVDSAIKYGGGDEEVVSLLATTSESIMMLEMNEAQLQTNKRDHAQLLSAVDRKGKVPEEVRQQIITIGQQITASVEDTNLQRQQVVELLDQMGEVTPREKGRRDDFSN